MVIRKLLIICRKHLKMSAGAPIDTFPAYSLLVIHWMAVFSPATRIRNRTNDRMVLITVNVFGNVEGIKVISPGGLVGLGYRKGVDRIGADVTFLVQPETPRPGVPGKQILPIRVFEYASIDVVYKSVGGSVLREYEDGAFVDFDFYKDALFRRIGLVKWLAGVFAPFGDGSLQILNMSESNEHILAAGSPLSHQPKSNGKIH